MSKGKDKISVLFVAGGMYIGGAETVIASLCRHLDREAFNVSVYHIKGIGEIGSELRDEGFRVEGAPGRGGLAGKYLRFLGLKRVVERDGIDIVHSHDIASLVDAGSCRLLSGGLRHIHTFHYGNYPHIGRSAYLLQKAFWRVPDRLVSVGDEQKAAIQRTFGIGGERIQTVWNGVEEKAHGVDPGFREMFGSQGKVVIGSISSFITQKGLAYLLEAAAELKRRAGDFIFVVAGDGPLRQEMEQKSRSLGLDGTVFFPGWVRNASSRLMPLFDIFYQPSLWEAMSVVVIEAMAAGKPVVATSVGENAHVVRHGRSGFIVEPRDTRQAVMALHRLVSDAGLRARFGAEGRRFYKDRCTVGHMARKYEQIYLGLLADRRRPGEQTERKGVYETAG